MEHYTLYMSRYYAVRYGHTHKHTHTHRYVYTCLYMYVILYVSGSEVNNLLVVEGGESSDSDNGSSFSTVTNTTTEITISFD